MTLKEIKAMFKPGQAWTAENTFHGRFPGPRTVGMVMPTQMTWVHPSTKEPVWMTFPKAAQVLEARDGFLKFLIFPDKDHTLTLQRL